MKEMVEYRISEIAKVKYGKMPPKKYLQIVDTLFIVDTG